MREFGFVVDSFEAAGRDGLVVPVEDAFAVDLERAWGLYQLPNAERFGGGDPVADDDPAGGFDLAVARPRPTFSWLGVP